MIAREKAELGEAMKQPEQCRLQPIRLAQSVAAALLLATTPATAKDQAADQPLYAGRVDSFGGLSVEEKVQVLADHQEILDLIATYAHRAAHGLSMADLFTDDGAFINRVPGNPPAEVRGREALDRYFGSVASAPEHPLPMIHNSLISIHGDEATGVSSIEVRFASNGTSMIGSGYYRDQFRRENARWKFVERDTSFFHLVPLQQGWVKPAKTN